MKTILIVSANPKTTDRLRLDEEVREIQMCLRQAPNRDQFQVITEWAVRVDDLHRALLNHAPQILHFSGHGTGSQGLVLEDATGNPQLVSTEALSRLFECFQTTIECVVLNACYSEAQAAAIFQHIDHVVGMNQAIGDRAAIEFAIGFYDALGAGRSYRVAFDLGRSVIALHGIPEFATPILKRRERPASPTTPAAASPGSREPAAEHPSSVIHQQAGDGAKQIGYIERVETINF